MAEARDVLVTGGTGYIGRALCTVLVSRGHRVRVLVRERSVGRVVTGAQPEVGNALDPESVTGALRAGDVLVHLVGTPHPSPAKAAEFQAVDLPSIKASVAAASARPVSHVVYVSVAHPAPVMKAYIDVRVEGERLISEACLPAVILRPWYVLGPGHWWPVALLPLYAAAALVPPLRGGASRLGLVTRGQMVAALVGAVESRPGAGTVRIVDVPAIRAAGKMK